VSLSKVAAARRSACGWLGPLLAALLSGVWGCSGTPLEAPPPAIFDLSGEWQLVADESDAAPASGDLSQAQRRAGMRALARSGVSRDFPVVVTTSMRIEQNADSMGIRYDNGEYRDISWGERERGMWRVTAGWQEDGLHIVSKAHDSEAHEVLTLAPDDRTLTVNVHIDAGEKLALTRVFERVDSTP